MTARETAEGIVQAWWERAKLGYNREAADNRWLVDAIAAALEARERPAFKATVLNQNFRSREEAEAAIVRERAEHFDPPPHVCGGWVVVAWEFYRNDLYGWHRCTEAEAQRHVGTKLLCPGCQRVVEVKG